jgi:hypothetical protein
MSIKDSGRENAETPMVHSLNFDFIWSKFQRTLAFAFPSKARLPHLSGRQLTISIVATFALVMVLTGNGLAELRGIYSLYSPNQNITKTPDLDKNFVVGASIRATWAVVQPKAGRYNWSIIDSSINQVQSKGKQIILRVVGLDRSPAWVMAKSQMVGDFMPCPWDPFYLSTWQGLIAALGDKYRNNPAIVLVEMAGAGQTGEMILDNTYNWKAYGYTSAKMIATWETIIDTYVMNFPSKLLALDINNPLTTDSQTLSAVINYCLTKYPGHIVFQNNGLNGRSIIPGKYDNILLQLSQSTTVGYQTTGSLIFNTDKVGDYHTMFQKAINCGASYLEIYQYDILAPGLQTDLEWLNQSLKP